MFPRLWAQYSGVSRISSPPVFFRTFHWSSPVLKKPKKPEKKKPQPRFIDRRQDGPSSNQTISKVMSWLLRHAAKAEGLPMRPDGYVPVEDFLNNFRLQGVDFKRLQKIVESDEKARFNLRPEPPAQGVTGTTEEPDVWWIRSNQGHTIPDVKVELQPITSVNQVRMAVHGTTEKAWESISWQGISTMGRHHIHLAQDTVKEAAVSGIRSSSRILIFIDLRGALEDGLEFFLSSNGVVLTPGNERGYLEPRFFKRVERVGEGPIHLP